MSLKDEGSLLLPLPCSQILELPSRELVPGDIVEIHTGDKVPADVRIVQLKTAVLRAEQASLTGESVPVNKVSAPVGKEDCELQVRTLALAPLLVRRHQKPSAALLHPLLNVQHCSPAAMQAKECMLFSGTGIASGSCLGVVNSIGMSTEIGKIQTQIQVGAMHLVAGWQEVQWA